MQQSTRRGSQEPQSAEKDQCAVKAHNKTVVPVDALHQCITQPFQTYQLAKILCGYRHIRNLPRYDSTVPHNDPRQIHFPGIIKKRLPTLSYCTENTRCLPL